MAPFYRSYADAVQVNKLLDGLDTCLPISLTAVMIMSKRYLQRDIDTNLVIETPEQLFLRVAKRLGETPDQVEEFYALMSTFDFLPGGRTLATAGTSLPTVSNCVVLDLEDTLDDILKKQHDAGVLQKAGSGIGFPFHRLRPAGSRTHRNGGVSSGPVSFMHCFNTTFGVIKERNRNGANMGAMRIDHPDILEFIHAKEREGALANFNISVGITNRFMKAVASRDKEPWMCEFGGLKMKPRRITRDNNFNILSIEPVDLTAMEIYSELVQCAWKTGEPGVLFMDTINADNPIPGLGSLETTNPCGEQPLHGGDACNLGSINLSNMLDAHNDLDDEKFERTIRLSVRLLDNVIDLTEFPVSYVNETVKRNRRIGLGIMGLADMFAKMGIRYGSPSAQMMAEHICRRMGEVALDESKRLARIKGPFANMHLATGEPRRNAAFTTIAPTGSIALLAGVNGGVRYAALQRLDASGSLGTGRG